MKIRTLLQIVLAATVMTSMAAETGIPSGFEKWIAEETEGEGLEASLLARNADPDNDGLSNLVEYALDTDPLFNSSDGLPKVNHVGDQVMLTYDQDNGKQDIGYEVQFSHDLKHWRKASTVSVSSKGSIDRRRATLTVTDQPLFVRLEVKLTTVD